MFAPLAFLLFGWGALMRRGSAAAVSFGFFAFAAAMGVSMSSIFLVFTSFSIVQTFLVTAIAFAGLSLWGYTTKKDLSGMGTFLIMGVIGLLVAMVINIFLQSPAMMFAISAIGILIFAGLTAFYTQQIKSDLRGPRGPRRPGVAGKGRHRRRAQPLHQLPEHVPVPADVHGATGITHRRIPFRIAGPGVSPALFRFGRRHRSVMEVSWARRRAARHIDGDGPGNRRYMTDTRADPALATPRIPDLIRVFGRIGLLSFGGPAAQIALMHRNWSRTATGSPKNSTCRHSASACSCRGPRRCSWPPMPAGAWPAWRVA
jgi:hypothetical protein